MSVLVVLFGAGVFMFGLLSGSSITSKIERSGELSDEEVNSLVTSLDGARSIMYTGGIITLIGIALSAL